MLLCQWMDGRALARCQSPVTGRFLICRKAGSVGRAGRGEGGQTTDGAGATTYIPDTPKSPDLPYPNMEAS